MKINIEEELNNITNLKNQARDLFVKYLGIEEYLQNKLKEESEAKK